MKEPNEWDEADLLRLVADGATESLELEFKSCGALEKSNEKKREVSKDVSALANSAGGSLVYGIGERDHAASYLDSGFDPKDISKEWLEQVINSNIHPKIQGLTITPVILRSKPGRVAYVVTVP